MSFDRIACFLVTGAIVFSSVGVAGAACYDARQQLPAQTIGGFTANPGQTLSQYPKGGAQLISYVRDLVASDPATLPLVVGLLANASPDQQTAIGSGLGQASRICVGRDQAFATQIQQAIAGVDSGAAKTAYSAVNPDVPIGVAGGAGGAGGGGGGTGTGGPTGGTGGGSGGPFGAAFGNNATANSGTGGLTSTTASGAGSISVSPR